MGFAIVGSLLLIGVGLTVHGYVGSGPLSFFGGLIVAMVALGPVTLAVGRGRSLGVLRKAALSSCVFVVVLLAAECAWRGIEAVRPEPQAKPFLSYDAARANPEGFRRWWNEKHIRFLQISRQIMKPNPRKLGPYVPIPGASLTNYGSKIRINQLGFRGPEIEREKGDRYRIVALGESTTWGLTILPDDRPWPEVLEARIRAEFDCAVPVEVVNAGVPGWSLVDQVARLPHDILPLQPDLILSYHGYNGFELLLKALPAVRVHEPPALPPRPSRILGAMEREARMRWFRRRYREARRLYASEISNDTRVDRRLNGFARHYERLVEGARGGGAQVVLATFNMAVNAASPEQAIRFYEAIVPDVRARIVANRIHTEVVLDVGRRLGVPTFDTSPGLDGAYRDAYVDIAHFNQLGRGRLAAHFLAGLREILATHPRSRCRPRAVQLDE